MSDHGNARTMADHSRDAWSALYHDSDALREDADYERRYLMDTLRHLRDAGAFDVLEKSEGRTTRPRYLEIGSGRCHLGARLNTSGFDVYGVDFSLEALQDVPLVAEANGAKITATGGDIRYLPFADNTIDLIFGGGVIEHMPDTAPVVRECYRVLRPGGLAFNTVPVVSLGTVYRQVWGNIPDVPVLRPLAELVHLRLLRRLGHLRFGYEKSFTVSTLRRLHRAAGFRRISIRPFTVPLVLEYLPFPGIRQLANRYAEWRPLWAMVYVAAQK